MITGKERYEQLRNADLDDLMVKKEIENGIRQGDGRTDIHEHLPVLCLGAQGNVLEIGTRYGTSTAALLYGVEICGGHVYSVDMNDCSKTFEGHPNWTFIHRDSKDTDFINSKIPDELGLLFIDGDHTYEGTLADIMNYGHRAKTIMVHDVLNTSAMGVINAVTVYFGSSNCRQKAMTIRSGSHGLAVLY